MDGAEAASSATILDESSAEVATPRDGGGDLHHRSVWLCMADAAATLSSIGKRSQGCDVRTADRAGRPRVADPLASGWALKRLPTHCVNTCARRLGASVSPQRPSSVCRRHVRLTWAVPGAGSTQARRHSGNKHHLLVKVSGLILLVPIHTAGLHDTVGARQMIKAAPTAVLPRLELVWADGACTGPFATWMNQVGGWVVEVPFHRQRQVWPCGLEEKPKGFEVIPLRLGGLLTAGPSKGGSSAF